MENKIAYEEIKFIKPEDSPESGSLYSDEIPSGYNSGEQYDTLSTGYMSGEAYELPETRMEIKEPTLGNVIEEDIVVQYEDDETTTDCNAPEGHQSPYHKKPLSRKKNTSFAIPLSEIRFDDPFPASDTDDTSALDSDINGHQLHHSSGDGGLTTSDSGAELLSGPGKRRGRKNRKEFKKCRDEEWFHAHDTFYWGLVRGICFWSSIIFILGSIGVTIIVIGLMPKTCDPPVDWYQGTVALEFIPDPTKGYLDLNYLVNKKVFELNSIGVQSIILKDLYDEEYSILNSVNTTLIPLLSKQLHSKNMTLLINLPIKPSSSQGLSLRIKQDVELEIQFWAEQGIDGIILNGLDYFDMNVWTLETLSGWKNVLNQYGTSKNKKILTTNLEFARSNNLTEDALKELNLLDASHAFNSNLTENYLQNIEKIFVWNAVPRMPWINWNMMNIRPLNEATLVFHMMLPGTISLQEKDLNSISLQSVTKLRASSVPIYMNGNYKNCDCEASDYIIEVANTNLKLHHDSLVQLERYYKRRNRYVFVGNFGLVPMNLTAVSKMYSGGTVEVDTENFKNSIGTYIQFKDISLNPGHAIVIKLPK